MPYKHTKCFGVKVSGYWKGYPCGASPTCEHEGDSYCANHLAEMLKDSGKADAGSG